MQPQFFEHLNPLSNWQDSEETCPKPGCGEPLVFQYDRYTVWYECSDLDCDYKFEKELE